MISRASYDLTRVALRLALQLWPLWLCWYAWIYAGLFWDGVVVPAAWDVPLIGNVLHELALLLHLGGPLLLGPGLLMLVAVGLYRGGFVAHTMPLAGIAGVLLVTLLTAVPEWQRLSPYLGDYSVPVLLGAVDYDVRAGVFVGLVAAFLGITFTTRKRPLGTPAAPGLVRARSDNYGHADWLPMKDARRLFPGPDPAFGGIVVGEAYRVDQDRTARTRFEPQDRRTWGLGGKAPLLTYDCRDAATHALVFVGAGGFKTTGVAVPTLLHWTASAVVLDPARELGPMLAGHRRQLGHQVVCLDPADAAQGGVGFNVLDWIDVARDPLAETKVWTVVSWLSGLKPGETSSAEFFRDRGGTLIGCILADTLWDPTLAPEQKTLARVRRVLVTPEKQMRGVLERIHQKSHSRLARDLAGSLMGAVKETFTGIYQNADKDTRWLSVEAYATLVSGSSFRTRDLCGGKLTVFVQLGLPTLLADPGLGRVIIGALLNAVYEADGRVQGRVLFLLDEMRRLGYMQILEIARDAGRKYGLTVLGLYQSVGQLVEQFGREGKRAWYESTALRAFARIQDPETADEVSRMCGEHGAVATSLGDSQGSQGRIGGGSSSSSGRSESRSEMRKRLIAPDQLLQDMRADEQIVFVGGAKPIRCGRALFFRRPEMTPLVDANRFHRGGGQQDAAE